MNADPLDTDNPGVHVPPPVYFALALATGLAIGREAPSQSRAAKRARAAGRSCMVLSAVLVAAAGYELQREHTTYKPWEPATALATGGVYGFTRNPLYLSLAFLSLGIALWQRSLPALALVPAALARLESDVVEKEERYLERRFGAAYHAYRNRVPRWF
ncbi:MAG: isoprenylcysteine carboxylmethyltransferase family protein [Candidatus Velthaea sp.]|jgi:protein-S-isoprenylcysteine O-methyltransferase Ste14